MGEHQVTPFHVQVVTALPEIWGSFFGSGIVARSIKEGHLFADTVSPRSFATDKHRMIDDTPSGGGGGMVLMAPPWAQAIRDTVSKLHSKGATRVRKVMLTPQGKVFTQQDARRLSECDALVLVCGRYEGFDERLRQEVDEEISIGDVVLMGGDVAAMCIVEATLRLKEDVLGNNTSTVNESHAQAWLEYPHYTRPQTWEGKDIPLVLGSGNHAAVESYRKEQSIKRTVIKRPDLLLKKSKDLVQVHAYRQGKVSPEYKHLKEAIESKMKQRRFYTALVHHPVDDRHRQVMTSAITNVDVHDIARSSCSYGAKAFFVVTPIEAQAQIVNAIKNHWVDGGGKDRIPERIPAIARMEHAVSIEACVAEIKAREGAEPTLVLTSARPIQDERIRLWGWEEMRSFAEQGPVLILFGTAHGLHSSVFDLAHASLPAVRGLAPFNHLSVRAAAAIIFDRCFGEV